MITPNLVFYIFLVSALSLLFFGFKKNLVISILLINLIADLTAGYLLEEQIHTGLVRGFFVTVLITIGTVRYVRLDKITFSILIFLFHLFIIIALFSSDKLYSYSHFLKWYTSVMLLPLSYYTLTFTSLKRVSLFSLFALALIIINFIISQFYELGPTHYDSNIHTGGTDVQISFTIALILIILPLIYKYVDQNLSKLNLLIIFSISFISMLLLGRRGAIFAYGAGLFVFLYFSKEKLETIIAIVIFFLVFVVSIPLFEDQLDKVLAHRQRDFENIEGYGRLNEIKLYPERVLQKDNIFTVLFGEEMFNYHKVLKSTRGLHTVYATLLYGSGIIGFLLYLNIIVRIFYRFLTRNFKQNFPSLIKSLGISLIVANVIIDFSGSGLLYRSFFYCFLGLFLKSLTLNYNLLETQDDPKAISIVYR